MILLADDGGAGHQANGHCKCSNPAAGGKQTSGAIA